ncbi:unnamed protein product [Withania somnifera]
MAASVQPEAILEWLQKEMGYQPLGSYAASSKAAMPTIDSIRKVFRGNMIPIWNFLLNRVKSEKTVEKVRRNILVHGRGDGNGCYSGNVNAVDSGRSKGRSKEKVGPVRDSGSGSSLSVGSGSAESSREFALQERDLAEKEVERLRQIVRHQRKELKARMLEVSREEAERKHMLDERSNCRHKQVMLEAYDQLCDEAAKIFSEYHKRLSCYVNQARNVKRSSVDSSAEVVTTFPANEKDIYSTFKVNKSVENVILIETTWERNIRKACECLAMQMDEKIRKSFPAYEGNSIHMNSLLQAAKLGIDLDGDLPDEVRDAIISCLKSPPQLLQAINAYAQKLKTAITQEIEKVDIRADAEILRYKYENDRVMDASSPDSTSPLHYQLYGNGKIGGDTSSRGIQNQLLERQKAHVQQFMATEDALNKAAEARNMIQQLLKRMQGIDDAISSLSLVTGGTSKSMSSLRQLELEVWTKEREAAGLKASVNTLMSEIQRLNKLCAERKEAEDSLRKKWKKIEEFDARRSELESIYSALLKASMV